MLSTTNYMLLVEAVMKTHPHFKGEGKQIPSLAGRVASHIVRTAWGMEYTQCSHTWKTPSATNPVLGGGLHEEGFRLLSAV